MVAEVSKPDFSYVWSSGGANVLPSNVKIQTGWVAEVPPFQWENALQNRQDNAIVHLFQKGISEWDAASNYYFTTGGVRSYVQGSDGFIYVAVADSIGQNPMTDVSDTYWKIAFADNSSALTITAADTRYTQRANNLSDVSSIPTTRTNLGVYSKAESDILAPMGYFYGLLLTNNIASPNTTIDVGAGQAKTTDNLFSLVLNTGLSGILQSTGSWTAGNNQNKLDTGAKAINSWYHIFIIRKTSDGSADILFSLSATSPTMPSGYSGFRYINSVKTDSSGNIGTFLNFGRTMLWKSPPLDVNISSVVVDGPSVLSVPTGIRTLAIFQGALAAQEGFWTYRSTDSNAVVPSYLGFVGGVGISTTSVDNSAMQCTALTNTSGQVYFRTEFSAAPFKVVTLGWTVV